MKIVIKGQVRGGKNNIIVCRNGMRVPSAKFKAWVGSATGQILSQVTERFGDTELKVCIRYFAGDKRRRDIPAIVDALFHVLEKVNITNDDFLIKDLCFYQAYDRENPRAEIELYTREVSCGSAKSLT